MALAKFGPSVRIIAEIVHKRPIDSRDKSRAVAPFERRFGGNLGRECVVAIIGEMRMVGFVGLVDQRQPKLEALAEFSREWRSFGLFRCRYHRLSQIRRVSRFLRKA